MDKREWIALFGSWIVGFLAFGTFIWLGYQSTIETAILFGAFATITAFLILRIQK